MWVKKQEKNKTQADQSKFLVSVLGFTALK